MIKDPPPLFVVRNSKHASTNEDAETNLDLIRASVELDEDQIDADDDESSEENRNLPSTIVQLRELAGGQYMLDFCSFNDFYAAAYLAENQVADADASADAANKNKTFYVDEQAWSHLAAYGELVGKPVSQANQEEADHHELRLNTVIGKHEGSFVLLEDAVVDTVHTLLSMERLFSWQTLVNARTEDKIEWRDIRRFLSDVRSKVPFLTRDCRLRSVVNTHLTFHQFVAFSRLVHEHLEYAHVIQPVMFEQGIDISDLFPAFDSLAQDEQVVELLASVKDKSVRTRAQEASVAIPVSMSDLVSITHCSDEWKLYIKWWNANNNDTRTHFCTREVLFAESNNEVRRNAEKDGISMRGRHSTDPTLREQFLRRFGAWYLGIVAKDDEEFVACEVVEEEARSLKKNGLYTYDFSTGEKTNKLDVLAHSSPPKMSKFNNKSWKPSSSANVLSEENTIESNDIGLGSDDVDNDNADIGDEDTEDQLLLSTQFMSIKSVSHAAVVQHESPPSSANNNEKTSASKDTSQQLDELDLPTESTPPNEIDTDSHGDEDDDQVMSLATSSLDTITTTSFIIGNKIKSKPRPRPKPLSFRRQFLKRLTSDIDNVTSMLKKEDGSQLRGIELFRAKVRLVMLLQKFSVGKSMQRLEAANPDNVDIFSFDAMCQVKATPAVKPKQPESPPKQVKRDPRIEREKLAKAKSQYEQSLRNKCFKIMVNYTRKVLMEKQKKLEQEQVELEREKKLTEKAAAAYTKCLQSRLFQAFREYSELQKIERAKQRAEVPSEPIVEEEIQEKQQEEEQFTFDETAPSVEKSHLELEDERSCKFRAHCNKFFGDEIPSLFDELVGMDLCGAGRTRPSGLDVVSRAEYQQHFAGAIELNGIPPSPASSDDGMIQLLDNATLQRMRKEKLAGASNLFDVPQSFIDPVVVTKTRPEYTEYRAREKVRGLLKQDT